MNIIKFIAIGAIIMFATTLAVTLGLYLLTFIVTAGV